MKIGLWKSTYTTTNKTKFNFDDMISATTEFILDGTDGLFNPDNSSSILNVEYEIKIPSKKFTGFGYSKLKEYYLQYWHLVPSIKMDKWNFYSNKNLNDIPTSKYNITELEIKTPENYKITTELKQSKNELLKDGIKYTY